MTRGIQIEDTFTDYVNDHSNDPFFEEKFKRVKEYFFSRNPEYWPCFSDPGLKDIVDFRQRYLHPEERITAYVNGPRLYEELLTEAEVPKNLTVPDGNPDNLLKFAGAVSKSSSHASSWPAAGPNCRKALRAAAKRTEECGRNGSGNTLPPMRTI